MDALMCGRFALDTTRVEIKTQFHVEHIPDLSSSFNIAPTQNVLILMQSPIDEMRHGESTKGTSPSAARRTGRDTLASSGSH